MGSNERGAVLDEAKTVINGQRQDAYGNPEDSFGEIAKMWTAFLSGRGGGNICLYPHDVAMMMALMKIVRIKNGYRAGSKPASRDSYVDLCGYTALAADIAEREVVDTSSVMA